MLSRLRLFSLGLSALALSGAAWGQAYPTQTVRIVVPAGPGGPDVVARIMAAKLTERMGQTFVVENRPGANGIIGAEMVARSAPDGHTLMVYSSGLISNKSLYKKLPYDTDTAFAPISNLVDNGGLFIAVHSSLPAKNLKELIALAKKPDAHLSYSTPGVGNTWHVATEVFKHYAGIKLTHIPYKGGGLAAAAVASGEVQIILSSPAPILPHAKSARCACSPTLRRRARVAPRRTDHRRSGPAHLPDGRRLVRNVRPGRHPEHRRRSAQQGSTRGARGPGYRRPTARHRRGAGAHVAR
jgi:tripartite-type tricarboxylate transporter receptor subunit TctC